VKRVKRLFIGLIIGIAVLVGGIWILTRTLREQETLYQGKSLYYWVDQVNSSNVVASNEAVALMNSQIIPQLTDAMFHDTNDSKLRLILIDKLNALPGVLIQFTTAPSRRGFAATFLGDFGPPAKAAIPALIQALKSPDTNVYGCAISSLGKIHSEPDVVIPLLVGYLDNNDLNGEASEALGNFGPPAKAAVPKLIRLMQPLHDRDTQLTAGSALKEIDPDAFTNVMREILEKTGAHLKPPAK
jgi:HEAT repeat protein